MKTRGKLLKLSSPRRKALFDPFLMGLWLLSQLGGIPAAQGQQPENSAAKIATPKISVAVMARAGWLVHKVKSPRQAGPTEIRVLLPEDLKAEEQLPVVFVLPVEPAEENRYGDGLLEIQRNKLHEKYRAIYVAPTFFHLPWYANHATDPRIRQEQYFMEEVVPFVLATYPISKQRSGRLLLGFSKSGWGAVSLLLRHPKMFERAAAWDAPLMMERLGKYGTTSIFGAEEVLDQYELPKAVRNFKAPAELSGRLILTSYGSFRAEHQAFDELLNELKIEHVSLDGPQRKHDWHSGWVAEALELLFQPRGE